MRDWDGVRVLHAESNNLQQSKWTKHHAPVLYLDSFSYVLPDVYSVCIAVFGGGIVNGQRLLRVLMQIVLWAVVGIQYKNFALPLLWTHIWEEFTENFHCTYRRSDWTQSEFTDMETTVLALMLCLVMTSFPVESVTIPLSMMDNSVDDMYDGCSEEMAEKVENENFPKEMNNNALFKRTWENEEKTANKKYKENSKILTQKQIKALIIYTGDDVHEEFNTAVQDSADKYGTDEFKYHTLYYLLTTAIQKLNSAKTCHTTYRRSYDEFTGTLNQEIRFGQFASASFHPNMEDFGTETCFQIETCLGAAIKDYSINRSEDEVLIPPYEKFKIMKIVEGTNYEKLKNCKKIFVVKNTGSQSKLNCRAAPPKQGSSGAL